MNSKHSLSTTLRKQAMIITIRLFFYPSLCCQITIPVDSVSNHIGKR